jgi:hypothetical protein
MSINRLALDTINVPDLEIFGMEVKSLSHENKDVIIKWLYTETERLKKELKQEYLKPIVIRNFL